MIPWYLRFMIIFPIVYFVPITCTLIEVYENDNRALWCVVFRNHRRSVLMDQDGILGRACDS